MFLAYRTHIRANPSELNKIARTLASLPALLIWCMISVFTTLLLATLQSWLPSPMQPPDPAIQKVLAVTVAQDGSMVLLYIFGLMCWLLPARLKFVDSLVP
ncbi:hypothetical protein BC629DRAFT_1472610 [Irpex lacteus]|nr:hypothetical protein BC629DRAFT_1472610 [Irpex lacteus]